jgi:protein disulfide-isomerase-like protein
MKYNLKNPTLMLFYADWCGHCNNFMPTFDKFSNNVNKSKVNIIKFNADNEQRYVRSFNIEGFPTLLLHEPKSNKFINYSGDRSIGDLVKFVNENTKTDITN